MVKENENINHKTKGIVYMQNEAILKKKIGKRIEGIRKEMNQTKEKLSRELGITPQYLGIVEKGKSSLSYTKLKRLCEISGYSSDYILFGKDVEVEEKTKKLLDEFSYEEIQNACEAIKQIAVFMKETKSKNNK